VLLKLDKIIESLSKDIYKMEEFHRPEDIIDRLQSDGVCPFTGLKIKTDPQWQNIKTGPDSTVSFYMVGERILLTLPSGDTSSADMNIYYEGRKEFLDEYGPENRKIIEIRDYSRIVGFPNKQARLDQTRHLLEEKNNLLIHCV